MPMPSPGPAPPCPAVPGLCHFASLKGRPVLRPFPCSHWPLTSYGVDSTRVPSVPVVSARRDSH